MKMLSGVVLVVVAVWLGSEASATVPSQMNLQGVLRDSATGVLVPDGDHEVILRIMDSDSGGSVVWEETRTLTTTSGLFNVLAGTVNPLSAAVFASPTRWLSVQQVGEGESLPRLALVTAPYTWWASHADTAVFALESDSPPHLRILEDTSVVAIGITGEETIFKTLAIPEKALGHFVRISASSVLAGFADEDSVFWYVRVNGGIAFKSGPLCFDLDSLPFPPCDPAGYYIRTELFRVGSSETWHGFQRTAVWWPDLTVPTAVPMSISFSARAFGEAPAVQATLQLVVIEFDSR